MSVDVRMVGQQRALLGECPVWSVREQVVYWLDTDGCCVHRTDLGVGSTETRQVSARPGSLALMPEPRQLLVAIEHELCLLDWDKRSVTGWVAIEDSRIGNRLNDGRCDPAGRFVVGSMHANAAAGRCTGALYQVDGDGSIATLRNGVGVPNGLAFDVERRRMYWADSPTETVLMFDYDPDNGRCENPRLFCDYSQLPGKPDGGCVDADGCYWSASVYGWSLVRFTPDGRIERRLDLPVQKPSMPCFCGPQLDMLVVTTIDTGGAAASEPGRDGFIPGSLLALDVGVTGVAEPVFCLSR